MLRVKVCGLTNAADAMAAAQAGADMLGFIFHPASRRHVVPTMVRSIVAVVRREYPDIVAVGVFVNEPAAAVARVLDDCGLQLAQLHGDESPADLGLDPGWASPLRGRAYRALRPRSAIEAAQLAAEHALPPALRLTRMPALLIDTYDPARPGGTGRVGDWDLAARLATDYPLLLAGGLTPENVAEAVRAVQPWGVDVASGVERAPGLKDHVAVRAFIAAARFAI